MTVLAGTRRTETRLFDIRWFFAGSAFAAFLIATQARALGGLAGLLLVGEDSQLRTFIEGLLTNVPLVRGLGHDGQIYFAIAHDLGGDAVGNLIDVPGIRYRRPVLPVLASLGGLLSGAAVLWSTAAWISAGTGTAWMGFRAILARMGASPMWMAALVAYPGFWLAIRLFTPDMIGLGAVLVGLALLLDSPRRLGWVVALMCLAVLAKEAFLVVPLGIGAWQFFGGRRAKGVLIASIPTVTLAAVVGFTLARFDVEAVDGNFGLPFTGIFEARDTWSLTPASDRLYVYLTIALLVVGVLATFAARSALVRWLIVPWIAVAAISSEWIWEIGNGLARSFAPLACFIALAFAERLQGRSIVESVTADTTPTAPTDREGRSPREAP